MPCKCQCQCHCPSALPQYYIGWACVPVWVPTSCHCCICLGEASRVPPSIFPLVLWLVSKPRPSTSDPAAPRSGTGRERPAPAPWGLWCLYVLCLPPFNFLLISIAMHACLPAWEVMASPTSPIAVLLLVGVPFGSADLSISGPTPTWGVESSKEFSFFFLLLSVSLGSCVRLSIFYRFCLLCLPWIIALLLV